MFWGARLIRAFASCVWLGLDCRWRSQYLADLLQEHQKLGPFMQVLPICSRLLNQGECFDLGIIKRCSRCYVSRADSIAAVDSNFSRCPQCVTCYGLPCLMRTCSMAIFRFQLQCFCAVGLDKMKNLACSE